MSNPAHEREMAEFLENERKMRAVLIGFILSLVGLIIILIFFRTQIWAWIMDLAILTGLAVNLITLWEKGKEWRG